MKKIQDYNRAIYPPTPESAPNFINSELDKIQTTLNSLIEAVKELQEAVVALQNPSP